jgi:hypothetical protein
MKDRFDASDWETLKLVPAYSCMMIAKEVESRSRADELSKILVRDKLKYGEPLHRQIVADTAGVDPAPFFRECQGLRPQELRKTRQLLRDKLTVKEYQAFVASVFIDQWNFAMRCDGDLNQRVENALYAFALFWSLDLKGVPVRELATKPGMSVTDWLNVNAQRIRAVEALEKLRARIGDEAFEKLASRAR